MSRLEVLRSWISRYLRWMLLACFAAVLLLITNGMDPIWGQSSETTQAAPAPVPEEINPQYEYNVKAAFLYSFGRYVVWPDDVFADPSSPFILGVCGEDRFGQVLDRIAQVKTIQGRRIVIRKMAGGEELQPCHILFVSKSISLDKQEAIIHKMQDKAVLLVGEVPGFTRYGGGINFFLEGGTVQFEINIDAIRQDRLILDAKLMSLGKKATETAAQ